LSEARPTCAMCAKPADMLLPPPEAGGEPIPICDVCLEETFHRVMGEPETH